MDWLVLRYRWGGTSPPAQRVDTPAALEDAAGDPLLIRMYYGMVAARLSCEGCGASLRRAVHVDPASADPMSGAVAVTTRCRGWRRHRHTALVTGSPGDLLLGELHRG
jgi:hypothetical protein